MFKIRVFRPNAQSPSREFSATTKDDAEALFELCAQLVNCGEWKEDEVQLIYTRGKEDEGR